MQIKIAIYIQVFSSDAERILAHLEEDLEKAYVAFRGVFRMGCLVCIGGCFLSREHNDVSYMKILLVIY